MKKIFIFFLLIIKCFLIKDSISIASINMESYCYVPPSLGLNVPPNVLFVIDVSGSMLFCAYNPHDIPPYQRCCTFENGCGRSHSGNEEGYFIPDKIYTYNTTSGYWEETTGTSNTCPFRRDDIKRDGVHKYRGSCLNFIYMTRADLLRWALTGGRPNSCNSNSNDLNKCNPESYPHSQLSCDSYGCILKTEFTDQKVKVPWNRITGVNGGLLFYLNTLSLKPRIGAMFYDATSVRTNKVYIGDFVNSANHDPTKPYKNTIAHINSQFPDGGTPTAPALWDALNYFSQKNPGYNGFQPSSGNDNWRNPFYQCFDTNNDGICDNSELKPVTCAKKFIILISDGQWNVGGSPNAVVSTCMINTGYESGSADPVVPAYWLRKKGFTNPVDGRTVNYYIDALYTIGFMLGGTGDRALKFVSIYGSFDTKNKEWPSNLTGYPMNRCSFVDDCCNFTNCGRGSSCTPLPPSSPDWDKNGDGIPDTHYSAWNATELKQSLSSAIYDIISKSASGTTTTTLASRSGISSIIFQPYYIQTYKEGNTEISWLGFLRSFWIDIKQNLREDTLVSFVLNIAQNAWDKIIQFLTIGDVTKIAILQRDTDIGTNACTLESIKDLNQVKPIFDSGCQLAIRDPDSRVIKFNNNGILTDFAINNVETLATIWQTIDSNIDSSKATCIIRYIRGENLSTVHVCNSLPYVKRPREVNLSNLGCSGGVKTWKLGDIINSSPSVVSNLPANIYHTKYGDSSYADFIKGTTYKNRPSFVFVGANDGMLHAIRIGTILEQENPNEPSKIQNGPLDTGTDKIGKEEWAFIPRNAIPYLAWYGMNNYCHIPTVDYRTMVVDAKINGSWQTLLIGTMGFGGKALPANNPQFSSSIFVLNISDPTNPSLLWEKNLNDNTLTLSFPAVVKIDDNWHIVIGTGPQDPKGTSFITAKIYFYNLSDGNLVKTLTIGGDNPITAAVGDIMPVDVNSDYSDDAIYFGTYTANNSGDFYRISFRIGNGYKSISALSNNDITKAVSILRPIFAAPNFKKDEFDNLWIFFGTGRFLGDQDITIGYTNYLIGYKDPCWNGSCNTTYSLSDFTDTTSIQVLATVAETKSICSCSATQSNASCGLVDVVHDTTPISSIQEVTRGWYYRLQNESIFSQPFIYGSIVDALTYKPSQDICNVQSDTNLLLLYYKSGTAYPKPSLLSSYATSGVEGTVTVHSKIPIGKGIPPLGNPFQIGSITAEQYVKFVHLSSGAIIRLEQRRYTMGGRFVLWIEK